MKNFAQFVEERLDEVQHTTDGRRIRKSDVLTHMKTLKHISHKYVSNGMGGGEWEIKHKGDREGRTSYFTNDHDDAIGTATHMNAERHKQLNPVVA